MSGNTYIILIEEKITIKLTALGLIVPNYLSYFIYYLYYTST